MPIRKIHKDTSLCAKPLSWKVTVETKQRNGTLVIWGIVTDGDRSYAFAAVWKTSYIEVDLYRRTGNGRAAVLMPSRQGRAYREAVENSPDVRRALAS